MEFEMLDQETAGKTIIKVVGVGGAGGNAVQHMIKRGVNGVEFICMNTDAGALQRSEASVNLQLGSSGLGAGAKPEIGAAAAEEARARIADTLQGAHMVFITAGMGGGTGTGAAPIVAQVAKEMGILTVGVISKPFDFEGVKRLKVAENGAAELESYVDSLIVVLNEKLFEVMGEDAEFDKAFACADDVLHNAVSGIAEIINVQGLINVDFEDVKTVMGEQGKAMMGTATVSGMDRARLAAEAAVASPLLEGVDLSGARGVLVNITASRTLKLSETREVMAAIRGYAADDATVIFGTVYDDSLGDALFDEYLIYYIKRGLRVIMLLHGGDAGTVAGKALHHPSGDRTTCATFPLSLCFVHLVSPLWKHYHLCRRLYMSLPAEHKR